MDGPHAPYLMPDGRTLASVLRAEAGQAPPAKKSLGRRTSLRGKDALWAATQRQKHAASSEAELAEIRAIERVGHRRRRQWLNDKLLRDLAGPMSTQDMADQFNPAPFGSYPPPSAFTVAAAPEHAGLWDNFRSIDPDKEAKVLERWREYNQQQQQQHRAHAGGPVVLTAHEQQQAEAAEALAKWAGVGRSARAALKKASVHSVLALEVQLLHLLEQDDADAELLLELPDGFARLLVHGLAQFHGLHSASRVVAGSKHVAVQRKAPQQQVQEQQEQRSQPQVVPPQQQAAAPEARSQQAPREAAAPAGREGAASSGQRDAEFLEGHASITCTDVVMALHELGAAGFDQHSLGRFVRSMHGSVSACSEHQAVLAAV